jgi:choline dehydrogenase-like flavoprotein
MNGFNGQAPRAVVVGSGAGGATVARELQGRFQVIILEAGGVFKPFAMNLSLLESMRATRIFLTEKMIQALFPAYRIAKTRDCIVLVHGKGIGGTTPLTCGNAVRADGELKRIGINLDAEFAQIEDEIHVTTNHRHLWRETTRELFAICENEGLRPFAVPKAGHYENCCNCGHCTLGCPYGVKWDSSAFVNDAAFRGTRVVRECTAHKIVIEGSRATGVMTNLGFIAADVVVVAAGGFGTPVILENSGIATDATLFVDPVLCVAAKRENTRQNRELQMPFAVQMDGYILSPYFDQLSFFFNGKWNLPGRDIVSLMIKLADENRGTVSGKLLTEKDRRKLDEAVGLCRGLLAKLGIAPRDTFMGTLNAGHPGGTLPLTIADASSLHSRRLPENVYVADSSLFPASLGNPPMLTVMALSKRIGGIIARKDWKSCSAGRGAPRFHGGKALARKPGILTTIN